MTIIRTQNRETLIEVDFISVYETCTKKDYFIGAYNSSERAMEVLGTYKSKERAMEVLDEIQHKVTKNTFMKNLSFSIQEISASLDKEHFDSTVTALGSCSIYEMPEK